MSEFQIFLDFKWSDFRSPLCYIITWYYPFDLLYSGDLKSNHSKSGNIWKVDFLKMVQILNGQSIVVIAKAMVLPIWKPDHYKSEIFCWISNFFLQNGDHLFRIQMVCLLDFRTLRNPDHLQTNLFLTVIWMYYLKNTINP